MATSDPFREHEGRLPRARAWLALSAGSLPIVCQEGRRLVLGALDPVTSIDRTSNNAKISTQVLGWITAITVLLSVVAVFILAMAGHSAAAVAVGLIGGSASAAGGIQVTVHIRR